MAEAEVAEAGRRLVHGVRTSILFNSTAYGFSVMVTAGFAMLHRQQGPATTGQIFLFAIGTTTAFAATEAAATRGFRVRVRPDPASVVSLGSAMATVSVTAALGVVALLARVLHGEVAWFVAPWAATVTFVLVAGTEMALARRAGERRDEDDYTDETEPGDGVPDDGDQHDHPGPPPDDVDEDATTS